MKRTENYKTLEERLQILKKESEHRSLLVGEIIELLSGKGRSCILIVLSLPFCQPIQIPGFSTPVGLFIALIGLRMIFGKHVWLPKKLLDKKIKPATLKKISSITLYWVKKASRWVHPRLPWFCSNAKVQVLNGSVIAVQGLLLALPIPIPFSNLGAAWSIFLIAFGTLEDDGLFVLLGYLAATISFLFLVFIVFEIHLLFFKTYTI